MCIACTLQISDELTGMLVSADHALGGSPLRSLHLGFTRIGEAGLEALAQLRGLTALSLEGEGVHGGWLQVQTATPLLAMCSGWHDDTCCHHCETSSSVLALQADHT